MAVDTATTIAGFDITKPAGSDQRAELDDSVRHVKSVLNNNLGAIAGQVTASHTELNYVTGVTSSIQTQLNAKGAIAGQTWTGAHSYTGATITVPTKTTGTSTTDAASTAFVQTEIARVNSITGLTRSTTSSTSFAVGAGQEIACTAATAWAATFPASPTVGTTCAVCPQNNLTTNTIDFGSNSVMGANGTAVSGVLTLDQVKPVYLFTWFGDYWREA